jgi:hypothetical protein
MLTCPVRSSGGLLCVSIVLDYCRSANRTISILCAFRQCSTVDILFIAHGASGLLLPDRFRGAISMLCVSMVQHGGRALRYMVLEGYCRVPSQRHQRATSVGYAAQVADLCARWCSGLPDSSSGLSAHTLRVHELQHTVDILLSIKLQKDYCQMLRHQHTLRVPIHSSN